MFRAENSEGESGYTGDLATSTSDIVSAAIQVEDSTITVDEGGTATFRARLTAQPTGTVTITASESDADISVTPSSRFFSTSNWNTYQSWTVSGLQDSDTADDSATITLTASGGGVDDTATVAVTVTDDDAPSQAPGTPSTPTLSSRTTSSLTLATSPGTGGTPTSYRWRISDQQHSQQFRSHAHIDWPEHHHPGVRRGHALLGGRSGAKH